MELLASIGPLLGQIAPSIATALGGPLAGMAVKALSNALLGHENANEAELESAFSVATPEQLAAVKKIDADFAAKMKELDIDLEKIAAGDRDSARQMQTALKDWVPKVLAIFITFGFFGVLLWLLFFGTPNTGSDALLMMIDSLSTGWTGVLQFYYGSSMGSKEKSAMLAKSGDGK
jgi:hypothetical protein